MSKGFGKNRGLRGVSEEMAHSLRVLSNWYFTVWCVMHGGVHGGATLGRASLPPFFL